MLNRTDDSQMIGCKKHNRTRQGTKRDYCLYGIYRHCWCGYDLKLIWRPNNQHDYELFEKTTCTLDKHYQEYNSCNSTSFWYSDRLYQEKARCGLHGLDYPHCKLCLEPRDGEFLGTSGGKRIYRPYNLADRILRLLKMK